MRYTSLKAAKCMAAILFTTLWGGAQATDSISISLLYGQKYLDQGDWEPVEAQPEDGLGATFQLSDWPVAMVGNLLLSSDSATGSTKFPGLKVSGQTTELSFGVRKNLTEGSTKVFAEGGLALFSAKLKFVNTVTGESASDSASEVGLWLGGGLDVMVSPSVSVGGLVRMSKADANDPGLGGTHFGLYAAYHFQR